MGLVVTPVADGLVEGDCAHNGIAGALIAFLAGDFGGREGEKREREAEWKKNS